MLNADTVPQFECCPRCKEYSYERLETHTHCVNCNYSFIDAVSHSYELSEVRVKALLSELERRYADQFQIKELPLPGPKKEAA